MWKDPIVEQVRRVRREHAAKFNYDIKAICEDIRRYAEEEIDPPSTEPKTSTAARRSGKQKSARATILPPRST